MSDVTQVLLAIERGEPSAAEELLPLVYDELRKLAAHKMANEPVGHTLQPTALVHEAWLRIARARSEGWNGRGHFFCAAAEAMRRILIESARRKRTLRRGGGPQVGEIDPSRLFFERPSDEILAVDESLEKLAREDPVAAHLVKLRYFAGLSLPEAAKALGISPRTADRLWAYARTWLRVDIETGKSG